MRFGAVGSHVNRASLNFDRAGHFADSEFELVQVDAFRNRAVRARRNRAYSMVDRAVVARILEGSA